MTYRFAIQSRIQIYRQKYLKLQLFHNTVSFPEKKYENCEQNPPTSGCLKYYLDVLGAGQKKLLKR